jgi:membrane protein DedA with SNARE-associated domain
VLSTLLDAVAIPGLAYAVILVLLTVDAFVPVVPTQALMIGSGVLTASGELTLALVVAAGALGAVTGDLACFGLGRRLARRGAESACDRRGGRISRLASRLTDTMRRHAFLAMLFCRFVPAGRMVASAHAGRSGYSLRRFLSFDVAATTLWASYGALLGHFGGEAIAKSAWLPLAIVGVAAVLLIGAAPVVSLATKARRA